MKIYCSRSSLNLIYLFKITTLLYKVITVHVPLCTVNNHGRRNLGGGGIWDVVLSKPVNNLITSTVYNSDLFFLVAK